MDTLANLQSAILDMELRHVNFFNGRLLSGEDLSAERDANHVHLRQLGQAIGAGVACGLEVSRAQSSPPSDVQVVVTAGMAINKEGQVLRLACDQTVSLVRKPDLAKKAECVFSDCAPFAAGTTLSGDGYYLLTIAPASQREGLAPISGLGNSPAACNSRYFTEGVQFRLLPMSVSPPSDAAHARNEVAYQCFGRTTRGLGDLATDATSGKTSDTYALENLIPSKRLTGRDVPLAVIEWKSGSGIGFIEMWSVRRRITRPELAPEWSLWESDSCQIENEARSLQFQDHIEARLASAGNPSTVEARQFLTFLPSAGVLPLAGGRYQQGFDLLRFFNGVTARRPLHVEGARARMLLQMSLNFPPIDLRSRQMIWQYVVRENHQAVDQARGNTPQTYLLFASGQIPYQAEPRFDVSRWSYSNYLIG